MINRLVQCINKYGLVYWIIALFVFLLTGFTTESPQNGRRGPIFLAEPPPSKVIPNNKGGLIPCSVYGNPYPTVHWVFGNGRRVESQEGVIEVLQNNSLYFPPFESDGVTSAVHTQTYRCVAENVIGRIISRSMRTTAGKCFRHMFVCRVPKHCGKHYLPQIDRVVTGNCFLT